MKKADTRVMRALASILFCIWMAYAGGLVAMLVTSVVSIAAYLLM